MTIACSLIPSELRARRAHIAAIAERAMRSRQPLPDGVRLAFDPAAEPALRELMALEAQCCPFLTLDLRPAGDALELTVTGPSEAAPIIAELVGPRPMSLGAPAD
jgi:hypothetical protein